LGLVLKSFFEWLGQVHQPVNDEDIFSSIVTQPKPAITSGLTGAKFTQKPPAQALIGDVTAVSTDISPD
jgi:hypothetical protein